jgi:tetratricopeptide (TPR) repeat protein
MSSSNSKFEEWETLFDTATRALVTFDHKKAAEHYRRAVEIAEQSLPESVALAKSLEGLGQSLLSKPNSDESAELFQLANEIRRAILRDLESATGAESLELAEPLDELARNYRCQKRSTESIDCYQRALDIRITHQGEANIEVVRTLERMASIYAQHMRDRKSAVKLSQRALKYMEAIEEQSENRDDASTVQKRVLLEKLGILAYEQEDYLTAEKLFQLHTEVVDEQFEINNVAVFYARVLVRLKKYEAAKQMLDYAEKHPRHGSGFKKFLQETRDEMDKAINGDDEADQPI